jgi:hypothetical protein
MMAETSRAKQYCVQWLVIKTCMCKAPVLNMYSIKRIVHSFICNTGFGNDRTEVGLTNSSLELVHMSSNTPIYVCVCVKGILATHLTKYKYINISQNEYINVKNRKNR